eukprot:gene7459-15258_t
MSRNFMELKAFLESRYPKLENNIRGENYPVPFPANVIGIVTTYLWWIGMGLFISGDAVLDTLGIPHPAIYNKMKDNKAVVLMALFMASTIGSNMTKTGAFEIILDGEVLFSRLETGRMPTIDEIIQILNSKEL